MTFPPIVDRELRIAARSGRTYWSRLIMAVVGIVVGGWLLFTMRAATGGMFGGRQLFMVLTQMGFYICLFTGATHSADSISREMRDGTLGFLFLTDLRGYDIIFGKLASGALISFYALLAMFPVFGLPLMLGGVSWLEFVQTMLALINALFFSHALALLISTMYKEAQKAVSAAIGSAWVIALGLPGLSALPTTPAIKTAFSVISLVSPMRSWSVISGRNAEFWPSFIVSHLCAWGFLLWASFRVTHCWKDKASVKLTVNERWQQWCLGNAKFRTGLKRELLDRSGYAWLISRGRFRKANIWVSFVFVGAAFALYLGFTQKFRGGLLPLKAEFIAVMIVLHFLLKLAVANETSRHFDRQKRNGELELLVSATPLRNQDFFIAYAMVVKRLYLAPIVFVLAVDCLMLTGGLVQQDGTFGGTSAEMAYAAAFAVTMLMLVFDLWSLFWVGMSTGLSVQRPGQGGSSAFMRVVFVPVAVLVFIQSSRFARGSLMLTTFWGFLVAWVAVCILTNLFFVKRAKGHLSVDLRRYIVSADEPLTWLGHLGRTLGRALRPLR